jgi:predicted O-methyltransferase YrrM
MKLFSKILKRFSARPNYSPIYNSVMDHVTAVAAVVELWSISSDQANSLWEQHRTFVEKMCYGEEITAGKTLSFDESFFIYVLLAQRRPRTIVEIGTQYGRSTRRLIDMSHELELNSHIVCYDIVDEVVFFKKGREAELRICDITPNFSHEIMDTLKADIVFLDARPRPLIEAVVAGVLISPHPCVLAIHDCARGICKKDTTYIPQISPTSMTGVWERHVLAEIFSIKDPLSSQLDSCDQLGMRLRIPSTRHGLGMLGRASCFSSSKRAL